MKKALVVMLALLLIVIPVATAADDSVCFSMDDYSQKELIAIRDTIFAHQRKDAGEIVIDKQGLIVEWNGLTRIDYKYGVADICLSNTTEKDIEIKLEQQRINGLKTDTWNSEMVIQGGERVLLRNESRFMFSAESVIDENGIDHISSFSMNIAVYEADESDKDEDERLIFEDSFSVALDMPLSDLWHY